MNRDIPYNAKKDETLEKRLKSKSFERLLSEMSARYINMPIEQIDTSVKKDFRHIAGLLGGDSCNFHVFDQEKSAWMTMFDKYEDVFLWARSQKFEKELKIFRSHPNFSKKMEYMFERWGQGSYAMCPSPNKNSEKARVMERFAAAHGIGSFVSVPIFAIGRIVGAIIIATHGRSVDWPEEIESMLRLFGEVLANALVRKQTEESLRKALSENQKLLADIKKLKDQIEADYVYLTEEINTENGFPEVVGESQALRRILTKVKQVAPTTATVLLLGETGTGKNIIARAIHNESQRSQRPLVQVNCAALAPGLIESELFGHEKGAFTGAHARRIGRFEIANRTTLFLDEIGELPMALQAKLLRVLQDGEFERVGGSASIKTDVRLIAATNRDLTKEVEAGAFRSDLLYRLNVFPIHVPALRERPEDLPLLIHFFVRKFSKEFGKRFEKIPHSAVKNLQKYHWPGNIRELENFVERAVISSPSGVLRFEMPQAKYLRSLHDEKKKFQEVERKYLLDALEKADWKIEGLRGAAVIAGLKPSTFRLHMKKYNIHRSHRRS